MARKRTDLPTFDEFAERAKAIAGKIPAEFLDGVEDVAIHREAKRHPLLHDIVTLGECEPSRLGAMVGSETVRSIVHLYYGSFADLAGRDPSFDVDAELRETIEHEIQHHWEDRAGVSTLIDEDDLFDAHQRFLADLETPKGWWRRGEELEKNVYAVEDDLFVELPLRKKEFDERRGKSVELTVLGEPFEAEIPSDAKPGEILTYEGEGLVADDDDEPDDESKEGSNHGRAHGHVHDHGKSARDRKRSATRGDDMPAVEEGAGDADAESEAEEEPPAAGDLHLVLDVR